MHRLLATLLLIPLSLACSGCEEVGGGGGNYTITTTNSAQGDPVVTYTTTLRGEVPNMPDFNVTFTVSAVGGGEWTNQMVMTRQVGAQFVRGDKAAWPEETVNFIPDGSKRVPFGGGEGGTDTFNTGGAAAVLQSLVGSRFVDVTIGEVKMQLDDSQIRGLAELLRTLNASGG